MVSEQKPDVVILVEPNNTLFNSIKKNYANIENVYIYNNAIYYNNDEDVELMIPSKNGILGLVADNGLIYNSGHFSLLPMNDWGNKEDMVKITSKSITFDKICDIHNITQIDYLQMDTEGFDREIIKMIDFTKYKIKTIRFEKWTFDPDCFTRYNEDIHKELGRNGMSVCIDKLTKHNYIINDIHDKMGNDYLATLIE